LEPRETLDSAVQTELFDLLGFEAFDLITSILERKDEIRADAAFRESEYAAAVRVPSLPSHTTPTHS
jgi:hypothetical protein